jgi:hypothetical protein
MCCSHTHIYIYIYTHIYHVHICIYIWLQCIMWHHYILINIIIQNISSLHLTCLGQDHIGAEHYHYKQVRFENIIHICTHLIFQTELFVWLDLSPYKSVTMSRAQTSHGIPVYGADLKIHFSSESRSSSLQFLLFLNRVSQTAN